MSRLTRFLLFLVVTTLVATAGLWILGGKKTDFSTSISIAAHPSQIFPYLTQPEQLKQWMTGLEQVDEILPIPKGEYAPVADTHRTLVDPSGRLSQFRDTVIRFTPDELISVQSTNSLIVLTSIFQLEIKAPRQTSITYQVKSMPVGLGRLLAPLRTSDLQKQIVDDVRRLKELVEREQPEWPSDAAESAASFQVPGFDRDEKSPPGQPLNNNSPLVSDVEPAK